MAHIHGDRNRLNCGLIELREKVLIGGERFVDVAAYKAAVEEAKQGFVHKIRAGYVQIVYGLHGDKTYGI